MSIFRVVSKLKAHKMFFFEPKVKMNTKEQQNFGFLLERDTFSTNGNILHLKADVPPCLAGSSWTCDAPFPAAQCVVVTKPSLPLPSVWVNIYWPGLSVCLWEHELPCPAKQKYSRSAAWLLYNNSGPGSAEQRLPCFGC